MTIVSTNEREVSLVDIVDRIALLEETSTDELTPLYDAVDPESLSTLLDAEDVTVSFRYCDYQVVVRSDGTVFITEYLNGRACV